MHKTRAMQHCIFHGEYGEKFFKKKMTPGTMGEGFIEVIEEGRESKPKKLFPNFNDLTK